jgi:cell wall-associated NlpC family hydrolase
MKQFRYSQPDGTESSRVYRATALAVGARRIAAATPRFQIVRPGEDAEEQTVRGATRKLAAALGDIKVGRRVSVKNASGLVYRARRVSEFVAPGDQVIDFARGEIGTLYVFGADNGPNDPGPDEYDCSGFTLEGWQTVGVTLPHQAEAQRTSPNVRLFAKQADAIPGDLVFMWFPNSRGIPSGHASHVGFFLKPGYVIDTRNPVNEPVAIRPSAGVIGFGRPS